MNRLSSTAGAYLKAAISEKWPVVPNSPISDNTMTRVQVCSCQKMMTATDRMMAMGG